MTNLPFGHPFGYPRPRRCGVGSPETISEADKVLSGLLAELPEQARSLMTKVDSEIARLQEGTQQEVSQIRERLEKQIQSIEDKAEERRKALLQHAIEHLEPLQKDLFRTGELAQALATFVQIQVLKSRLQNFQPDPGNLLKHQEIGKTFYFKVVGSNSGPVWGTDIYTADSWLSTAAVHAGAVELGEEGIVKVSIVDMSRVDIFGSYRNGVTSMDWESYPVGYRVSRG